MSAAKRLRTALYARVSTFDQDPTMQLRELRAYAQHRNLDIVGEFIDQISGAKAHRPQLDVLWKEIRSGKVDRVLVWKFDRFARSTRQLVTTLEELQHLGVDFISITEQIDTGSPMGKAMFTIISAIAEFERSLIGERVRSGMERARAEGKHIGRARIDRRTQRAIKRLRQKEKLSIRQIAERVGVSRGTVQNYI